MLGCLSAREVAARRGGLHHERAPGEHPLMGVVLEGEVEMISEDSFGKSPSCPSCRWAAFLGESYTCIKAKNRTIAYQARTASRVLLLGLWADPPRLQAGVPVPPPDDREHGGTHRGEERGPGGKAGGHLPHHHSGETPHLSGPPGGGRRRRTFTVPMSRTALAEYLCADRSAMTRELAHMKAEGLIDYDKRQFTLKS